MKKPKPERADNANHKLRRTDHTYSDLFGQSGTGGGRSPAKKMADDLSGGTANARAQPNTGYNAASSKSTKHNNLVSSLDTHTYQAVLQKSEPEVASGT